MTRIGVEELLTQEQLAFFTQVAGKEGLTLGELLRRVIDAEYKRLFFTERSKRSSYDPKFVKLFKDIEGIFEKLLVQYGQPVFGELFEKQVTEFKSCKTLEQLEDFNKRQPWVLKKW